jgi:hypothetical protein
MKIKTISCLLGLFLTMSAVAFSANPKTLPSFSEIVTNRFLKQWVNLPQEKVYLHTDKPYYSAGEEIWFKAYLLNATTLEPKAFSQFVYVELIDKRDSVFYRVKIKSDSLGFSGHIKLNPDVPTGNYSLRAYTYWMQNVEADFFFTKNILIGNSIDDRISSQVTYGTQVNGLIPVSIAFTDAAHNPIAGKRVVVTQNWKSAEKRKFAMVSGKDGKIDWQTKIDSTDNSKKCIDVSLEDEKYKNTFFVPVLSSDYDVQFFPESGILLANVFQTVGFKAIGKNGLSTTVTGKVFNSKNEEVAEIETLNKGMGKFGVQINANETYHAVVKNQDGLEKRFELPKAQEKGVVLNLLFNKGKILYEVINNSSLPDKSLYLLLHSRGRVFVAQPLSILKGQISESILPAGIASLSVIDSLGQTYCERLTFVRNFNLPAVTLAADKPVYRKREAVKLSLNVQSALGTAVNGNFSISITDNSTVKQDSLADNILTNLLLTSDIKGYVEDPAAYFVDNSALTREKTDALMLTQGWHRFKTAEIVKGQYKSPKYYIEAGQALSGKVLNIANKPAKKNDVIALSSYKNLIRSSKTDSLGRYLLDGLEFPDSTTFVIKANKAKSIADVEVIPDKDIFPESNTFIPSLLKANAAATQAEYFKLSKEKYYYEGGMRVISLNEVTVKAAKKPLVSTSFYTGLGDSKVTAEQLADYKSMSLMDLFLTIPGVQVNGDKISIRGSSASPLVLIDDIEMHDSTELTFLTADDLASVDVFKGVNTILFGPKGANGVITIALKKGEDRKTTPPISLAHVTPLGYQKPAEFYVPKYEVDSVSKSQKPDLRTTVYWNPKLRTDKDGNIKVNFFTADKANNYSVILEGVSNIGEICRYVGVLKRENQ